MRASRDIGKTSVWTAFGRGARWSVIGWFLLGAREGGAAESGPADAARGREIYLTGNSVSGSAMTAILGEGTTPIPAAVLRCVNCHGADGHGRPEGGVVPSDITWEALTKPYEVGGGNGRRRVAYDARKLNRAITMGWDSSGNPLGAGMPKFQLGRRDLEDLVAYLMTLGRDEQPGVSDTNIRIGTLLPPEAQFPDLRRAIRSALEAVMSDVNRAGGIYGRTLELDVGELPVAVGARAEAMRRFVTQQSPFALVAVHLAGAEESLEPVLDDLRVPVVGVLSLDAGGEFSPGRMIFRVDGGLASQGRALVRDYLRSRDPATHRLGVLRTGDRLMERVAKAVAGEFREAGALVPATFLVGEEAAAEGPRLRAWVDAHSVDAVLVLAPAEVASALLKSLESVPHPPRLLVPGGLLDPQLLDFGERCGDCLIAAFPSWPTDRTADGMREYARWSVAGGLRPAELPAQTSTMVAAKILVEALRRAGRDLRRENFLAALAGLRAMESGFTRPISFGAEERVGIRGAYIVTLGQGEPGRSPARWLELTTPVDGP